MQILEETSMWRPLLLSLTVVAVSWWPPAQTLVSVVPVGPWSTSLRVTPVTHTCSEQAVQSSSLELLKNKCSGKNTIPD